MAIVSIHHVSLLVRDTRKALDFYRKILDLPIIERTDLGFPGAWLEVGGQQIHLLEIPASVSDRDLPEHVGRDGHIAFQISNLNEMKQRLEDNGIPYTMSRSGRRALFCRDPDGNGVELIAM